MIQQRFWHPLFFLCLSLSNTHILGMTHARFLIHTPTTYTITHTDNASPLSSEQQTLSQEHLQVDSLSLSLSLSLYDTHIPTPSLLLLPTVSPLSECPKVM